MAAEDFTDDFTRVLLRHTGSTTQLLQEHLACRLSLGVVNQSTAQRSLVRRSQLLTPTGLVVSRNLVVGQLPSSPELARAVTGRTVPLGAHAVVRRHVRRRVPLVTQLAGWPERPGRRSTGPLAVRRVYLLCLADEPPLYVEEHFHPAVVPPSRSRP